MRLNFTRITGVFLSCVFLVATKIHAEGGSLEDKFRPSMDDLDSDNVLQNGQLIAARDSDSAVDRAFGKMDKKRAKQQKYKYWYLLPFGIPQFTEGYRGIGSAMAVGQVASLMLYYDRMKKVDSLNQNATDATRGVAPAQAAANPFLINFLNQNEKQSRDAQKEQKYFLFTFLGLYGFSVYEALYDPLDYRKVDALRKRKSKDRDRDRDDDRGGSRDRDDDRGDDSDDEAFMEKPSRSRRSSFGFMVVPTEEKKYEVAVGWQTTLP